MARAKDIIRRARGGQSRLLWEFNTSAEEWAQELTDAEAREQQVREQEAWEQEARDQEAR